MTIKEFQELAEHMKATVVFHTSATAVFDGPRYNITVSLSEEQLAKTTPLEVANLLASVSMVN